jgi:plasmid stabilization system protein ParE
MGVGYHPEASQELVAAALFYHEQAPGLGGEFLDEVEHTESFLVQFPAVGRVLRGDIRRLSLRRFPYDLIYQLRGDHLWILAVAHQRRRPGYWGAAGSLRRAL